MKRFYREVGLAPVAGGWQVMLDARAVKTVGGRPQIVPGRALGAALVAEWAGQGVEIDPRALPLRDLADHALDAVAPDRASVVARLARYAETDTLCYRAEPEEPLFHRQQAMWEPWVAAAEARYDIRFVWTSGVIHRPQPTATLARLGVELDRFDAFTLAALEALTSLSASLIIGLAARDPLADVAALWAAAELEEAWQAEQWGRDAAAEARRARRAAEFATAARFAHLARAD